MTHTAKIYGDGLYDLATEENLCEVLMQQLEDVLALFRENPDYVRLLAEPSIPKTERVKLVEDAFGGQAERYLINFLKILCERGIVNEFSGCVKEYTRRYNEDRGITEAVVYSAVELTKEQLSTLQEKLAGMSGKQVKLTQKRDPKVLAGLRVVIDGKELDGSVKGRLDGISKKLHENIV